MPPIYNILIMIHGMTPNPEPSSPFGSYEAFWQRLLKRRPDLPGLMRQHVGVQWGHAMPVLAGQEAVIAAKWGYTQPAPPPPPRSDERLTAAEATVVARVAYDNVRRHPGPHNQLCDDSLGWNLVARVLRPQVEKLQTQIILPGCGDVVYYCSAEGETAIRRVVYGQILSQLSAVAQGPNEVRLHVVAHSLGVTVAHDFLYGLFAPDHKPDFLKEEQGTDEAQQQYDYWRGRAQLEQKTLRLGTFCASASQLPILLLRKQKLVDDLANKKHLAPHVIGIDPADPRRRWLIFYDRDDPLGFATRGLYQECAAIGDVQVDVDDWPDRAHTDYWQSATVIERMADLLAANCAEPVS